MCCLMKGFGLADRRSITSTTEAIAASPTFLATCGHRRNTIRRAPRGAERVWHHRQNVLGT